MAMERDTLTRINETINMLIQRVLHALLPLQRDGERLFWCSSLRSGGNDLQGSDIPGAS